MTRRFLKARGRGRFSCDEVSALLHPDAEYTEVVGGEPLTIVGADAINQILLDQWRTYRADSRTAVIRLVVVDDHNAIGHWVRRQGERLVHGRDTYTVVDGLISRVEVEEFDGVRMPLLMGRD